MKKSLFVDREDDLRFGDCVGHTVSESSDGVDCFTIRSVLGVCVVVWAGATFDALGVHLSTLRATVAPLLQARLGTAGQTLGADRPFAASSPNVAAWHGGLVGGGGGGFSCAVDDDVRRFRSQNLTTTKSHSQPMRVDPTLHNSQTCSRMDGNPSATE